ncbi:hypothetical protein Bbelb_352290 [Branchiostoma belcheri]|nr:hypothetical protein Bbelb_352290 [Branchiostoma belcheri]
MSKSGPLSDQIDTSGYTSKYGGRDGVSALPSPLQDNTLYSKPNRRVLFNRAEIERVLGDIHGSGTNGSHMGELKLTFRHDSIGMGSLKIHWRLVQYEATSKRCTQETRLRYREMLLTRRAARIHPAYLPAAIALAKGGDPVHRRIWRYKKALRIIGVNEHDATTELNIPSLLHRRQVAAVSLIYKMHMSTCPPDLKKMLPQPYTIRRTTRSSLSTGKHALTVPVSRPHATDRTFIHTAVDIWNSLPDNVVGRMTTTYSHSKQERKVTDRTRPGTIKRLPDNVCPPKFLFRRDVQPDLVGLCDVEGEWFDSGTPNASAIIKWFSQGKTSPLSEKVFETVSTNLEVLFPNAFHNDATLFTGLQEQCFKSGKPWGGTLISRKEKCRICGGSGGGGSSTFNFGHPPPYPAPCPKLDGVTSQNRRPAHGYHPAAAVTDTHVGQIHGGSMMPGGMHGAAPLRRDLIVRTPRGTPPVAGIPSGHISYVTDQMNRIKAQLKMEKWHRPEAPFAGVMTYANIDDKWVRVGWVQEKDKKRVLDGCGGRSERLHVTLFGLLYA